MKRSSKKIQAMVAHPDVEGIEPISDEVEDTSGQMEMVAGEILHAEPGAIQAVKSAVKGHGEQTILPDDCEFGDNDLCYVDS
ncbi:MAG TPA: hypothetical protein VLG72_00425 [Nitrospirota bacterium]|nr:hypothetical protein [Nitrospirota bacterium]